MYLNWRVQSFFGHIKYISWQIHGSKQLKDQPVLLLSSFVHNSSINEHENMKLRENICYEMIH